ncbi:glycerol-3-phosphate acyltransferase 1, mitochondrial isoform X2 [Atheta coriaria]|uniref:glycerol-3-phosphate acyltransferase 1, mitochondrial isoform X2 n=1 Tax=Dalotia coriaria TaxID=877792 RepID=UPI0031F39201
MDGVWEALFFVGVLWWVFPNVFMQGIQSIGKMVDLVSKRMFDSFQKYAPTNALCNESLASIETLKRFSHENRTRKKDFQNAHANLFAIKEDLPQVAIEMQRKACNGLTCYCIKSTSPVNESRRELTNLALKNILDYCPATKKVTLMNRIFNHLAQVYELKKYPYPQVEGTVVRDERVKRAIDATSLQQFQDTDGNDDDVYQGLLQRNTARAKKLLHDMRSKLSDFLLRFTSWVLYKLLPCFLNAVVVHPQDVEMLQQAGKTNLPMIFLPLHRSHLDYILMSFILLNNDVKCPLVASGDNLRIPFFGSLLRGLGAFFIKRRVDPIMGRKDLLYKTILHTYMNESLRAGHNIEFFLEGGRTRTGKPCMPKYGILSVIVEAVIDGTVEDALLVPVSINYEKLVDGNFVREQLGQPKEMESFWSAIKAIWHVLNSNYGMIRVDFNQPFSLCKMIKTFNTNGRIPTTFNKQLKSNPSSTSLYGTDVVSDEHKSIVESISKHVIYDCSFTQAVMSTNAVAFLLLNKFRNGCKAQVLVDALEELKLDLIAKGKEIGFVGDNLDIINYSIDLLGPGLVRKEKDKHEEYIRPVAMLPNVIELSYYSNALVPTFALDSLIAISLFAMDLSKGYVDQTDLIEHCTRLCDHLQYEFIFCKPCQTLEDNILGAIDNMIQRHECFSLEPRNEDTSSKRVYFNADMDDDNDVYIRPVRLYLNSKGKDHLLFLRSLLMPLVDIYAVTAECMTQLVGRNLHERELVGDILEYIRTQLRAGSLQYQESVSVDPIKNALKLFQKMDLVEIHQEKKIRLYYLKDEQDNDESVRVVYDKINAYRRKQTLDDDIFDKLATREDEDEVDDEEEEEELVEFA